MTNVVRSLTTALAISCLLFCWVATPTYSASASGSGQAANPTSTCKAGGSALPGNSNNCSCSGDCKVGTTSYTCAKGVKKINGVWRCTCGC